VDERLIAALLAGHTDQLHQLTADELTELRDRALGMVHTVRAELRHRRRAAADQRAVERIRNRASCVFCRRVFQVEHLAEHQFGQHRVAIAEWATPRQRARQ